MPAANSMSEAMERAPGTSASNLLSEILLIGLGKPEGITYYYSRSSAYQEFLARLYQAPTPNAALRKTMQISAPWEQEKGSLLHNRYI